MKKVLLSLIVMFACAVNASAYTFDCGVQKPATPLTEATVRDYWNAVNTELNRLQNQEEYKSYDIFSNDVFTLMNVANELLVNHELTDDTLGMANDSIEKAHALGHDNVYYAQETVAIAAASTALDDAVAWIKANCPDVIVNNEIVFYDLEKMVENVKAQIEAQKTIADENHKNCTSAAVYKNVLDAVAGINATIAAEKVKAYNDELWYKNVVAYNETNDSIQIELVQPWTKAMNVLNKYSSETKSLYTSKFNDLFSKIQALSKWNKDAKADTIAVEEQPEILKAFPAIKLELEELAKEAAEYEAMYQANEAAYADLMRGYTHEGDTIGLYEHWHNAYDLINAKYNYAVNQDIISEPFLSGLKQLNALDYEAILETVKASYVAKSCVKDSAAIFNDMKTMNDQIDKIVEVAFHDIRTQADSLNNKYMQVVYDAATPLINKYKAAINKVANHFSVWHDGAVADEVQEKLYAIYAKIRTQVTLAEAEKYDADTTNYALAKAYKNPTEFLDTLDYVKALNEIGGTIDQEIEDILKIAEEEAIKENNAVVKALDAQAKADIIYVDDKKAETDALRFVSQDLGEKKIADYDKEFDAVSEDLQTLVDSIATYKDTDSPCAKQDSLSLDASLKALVDKADSIYAAAFAANEKLAYDSLIAKVNAETAHLEVAKAELAATEWISADQKTAFSNAYAAIKNEIDGLKADADAVYNEKVCDKNFDVLSNNLANEVCNVKKAYNYVDTVFVESVHEKINNAQAEVAAAEQAAKQDAYDEMIEDSKAYKAEFANAIANAKKVWNTAYANSKSDEETQRLDVIYDEINAIETTLGNANDVYVAAADTARANKLVNCPDVTTETEQVVVVNEDVHAQIDDLRTKITNYEDWRKAHTTLGDANGDGNVNVADVTAVVDYILGKGDVDIDAADINADGVVNVADVTAIVNTILGK